MKRTLVDAARPLFAVTVFLATAILFCSCTATSSKQTAQSRQAAPPLFKWWGDEMSGPVAVRINLDEQKGTIYRGGQEAGWTVLASGTTHHPTPSGTFYVMEKIPDKVSNTYGVIVNGAGEIVNGDARAGVTSVPAGCHFVGAQMPYWMRITSYGVGMHAGDIPEPGMPASHGCIRLPRDFAGTLYSVVSVGTPVVITGTGQSVSANVLNQAPLVQSRASRTAPPPRSSVATLR